MATAAGAGAGSRGSSFGGARGNSLAYTTFQSYISEGLRRAPFLRNDQICGMDTDEVFAYSTKKVVWIRDRYVGVCYYSLIVAVVLWILGWQILCKNQHFLMKDVEGLARVWYSHPTVDNCDPTTAGCKSNFTNIRFLPYCDAAMSSNYTMKAHCEYEDKLSLVPQGITNNKFFLTTAMEIITERKTCHPSLENNFTCENTYTPDKGTDCLQHDSLCRIRGNKTDQFFYVADVKNFKVRFTSSYARDDIRGTSLMHPAFVGVCPSLLRVGSETRTWSARKVALQQNECQGNLKVEKLPCEYGVDCAQMRKFDLLEDSGVSVVSRNIKTRIKNIGEQGESLTSRVVHDIAQVAISGAGSAGVAEAGTTAASSFASSGYNKLRKSHAFLKTNAATVTGPELSTGKEVTDESTRASLWSPEYSDNWGDVFTVARLLELAGADLDLDFNMDGWTTRQAGTVLEVRAVYNNLYPVLSTFGYKPVRYHYEVHELMLPYVSRAQMSEYQPHDYPSSRKYEIRYGILITFNVAGSFGFFNLIYLLLMLTTAFALTATATTVTDLYFLYLSDQKDNFFHLKYEVTPDFSDMWRCDRCGYSNLETDNACKGVPKFMCPRTTPMCGAARPKSPETTPTA